MTLETNERAEQQVALNVVVPECVLKGLREIEQKCAPIEEITLRDMLAQLIPKEVTFSDEEKLGVWAELNAFFFSSPHNSEREPWGTYFVPMGSGVTQAGEAVYFPDAAAITPAIIRHWRTRAVECPHPTLRARYSDLAWEFARFITGSKADQADAVRTIDAYLDAVENKKYESEHQAWRFVERAIELAINLKDHARKERGKTALFCLFRMLWAAGDRFMWWQLNDIVRKHKNLKPSEDESKEIVSYLEAALSLCSDKNNKERFDPYLATGAATRLAEWYAGQDNERKRVILEAGKAYEDVSAEAAGLTAVAWLEDVLRKYKDAGLNADVARVENMIRQKSKVAQNEMQRISSTIEIDRDEYDKMLNDLIEGGLHKTLRRIAVTFLVKQHEVDDTLQDELKVAPFTSHIDIAIPHSHGFTAAIVGSIKDDYTGRAIHQASKLLGFKSAFLDDGLRHAKKHYDYSASDIVGLLFESDAFAPEQKPIIEAGIAAWLRGESMVAIHLLVPQVEAILREIAMRMGVSTLRPNPHTSGFAVDGMGNILHDPLFSETFEKNVRHHLIALYTDPRGQNLRNALAHGLIGHERLNTGLANWVVHSLILLSMLRVNKQAA